MMRAFIVMHWMDLGAVVVMGLAGSGHCVGMCGGFALAIGRGAKGHGALVVRHLAYTTGKALTYVFLAVLVAAGLGIVGRAEWFKSGQLVLSIAAGMFMVVYGSGQLLEWRIGSWWQRVVEPLPGCRGLAAVARTPGPLAAFATGWLNGFLPCGLLLAVLMHLASLGSVSAAALGAAAFGLATFPGLFLFGLLAQGWSVRWRRVLVRVAGVLLIAFGAITIVRAFPEGRHWLHHEVLPGVTDTIRDWCGM
ncbi:sulfite exporter TauE/SafE family protein [Opitutales bacterium ASA1]|nr:sulfite exporter TauE/SafE family protein [Opitutales bacterium ASA1]